MSVPHKIGTKRAGEALDKQPTVGQKIRKTVTPKAQVESDGEEAQSLDEIPRPESLDTKSKIKQDISRKGKVKVQHSERGEEDYVDNHAPPPGTLKPKPMRKLKKEDQPAAAPPGSWHNEHDEQESFEDSEHSEADVWAVHKPCRSEK